MKPTILSLGCVGLVTAFLSIGIIAINAVLRRERQSLCAQNLRQLFEAGQTYATAHGRQWPSDRGDHLWIALARTEPPLLATLEVLRCPLRDESFLSGPTDYRGPQENANLLKEDAPLGADKASNHGDEEGGHVP